MDLSDDRRYWYLAIAVLATTSAIAVWLVATRLFPYHSLNHDEAVYLQQAAMLLDGQLFLSPPVDGSFRPWFFVDDGARLYPKYAPVPAAVFALGMVLGGPRLALAAVAAGIVALVALVVAEVFDRPTGLVAAVLVLTSPLFLIDTAVFLPYAPTTLLNLAFLYCYLRADRDGDRRWAAGAGAFVGLAFFARPYTAVLFAAPVICHALWTLRQDPRGALPRQALTAVGGLGGVCLTLGYNAVMTGSPLLFPYQVFAPRDGLGFGYREILGYSIDYTVELALRANALVLEAFATRWVAGGTVGTAIAVAGLAVAVRRGLSEKAAILAGQILTITVGNVYFWGSRNILGDMELATDGLIVSHGPYYHFDLLVPFAAFGGVGILTLVRTVRRRSRSRLDRRGVSITVATVLLVTAAVLGGVTATNAERPVQYNGVATDTYDEMYAPVENQSFENALVFLPTPYGDWLNHPFQPLRNDPDFDGRVVYAMDEQPFELVDAYPNRSRYRLVYRGDWAPYSGSPRAARLQSVDYAAGTAVTLNTTVGIPRRVATLTVTVSTDEGSETTVITPGANPTTLRFRFADDSVRLRGPALDSGVTVPVESRDTVGVSLFLDRGPGASFSYELDVPVAQEGEQVRVLTPRIERCVAIGECGDAGYVPGQAPANTYLRTNLTSP